MTAQVTEQDLRARLTDAEREEEQAERAVGAAELDGRDGVAASKRLADARAAVDRLERALETREEREAERRDRGRETAEAVARWRVACWWAEYVKRAAPVIELRARLADAEQQLMALGGIAAATGRGSSQARDWLTGEALAGRLDLEAVNALPDSAVDQPSVHPVSVVPDPRGQVGLLTVADCEAWARRLEPVLQRAAKQLGGRARPGQLPWSPGGEGSER